MFINRSTFTESPESRHKLIVDGEIYIKGTFTREEWDKLKDMFLAGMLRQHSPSKPKKEPLRFGPNSYTEKLYDKPTQQD